MKLGLAQLKTGENRFRFRSQKEAWLANLLKRVASQGPRVNALEMDLSLTKLEPDYYLKGQLRLEAEQACARCAETFSQPIAHGFELGLAHIRGQIHPQTQLSQESEELDIHYFDGDEIDLAPLIEEQLVLSFPYAPICRPDCRGICQQCGTDLNRGNCRCLERNPVSAFAALTLEPVLNKGVRSHGSSQETKIQDENAPSPFAPRVRPNKPGHLQQL